MTSSLALALLPVVIICTLSRLSVFNALLLIVVRLKKLVSRSGLLSRKNCCTSGFHYSVEKTSLVGLPDIILARVIALLTDPPPLYRKSNTKCVTP